ncbi:hypothetical protein HGM15179_019232, partial [Zosterops borbonicus]
ALAFCCTEKHREQPFCCTEGLRREPSFCCMDSCAAHTQCCWKTTRRSISPSCLCRSPIPHPLIPHIQTMLNNLL